MEAIAEKTLGGTPTELKARVLAVRPRLPQNVRALVMEKHPEYNTAQGSRKLNNVLAFASSDAKLTAIIESLALPLAA